MKKLLFVGVYVIVTVLVGCIAWYAGHNAQKKAVGISIPFDIVHSESVLYDDPRSNAASDADNTLFTSQDSSFSFYYPSALVDFVTKNGDNSVLLDTKKESSGDVYSQAQIRVSSAELSGSFEEVIKKAQTQQAGSSLAAVTSQQLLMVNGMPMYEYTYYTAKSGNRVVMALSNGVVYTISSAFGNDSTSKTSRNDADMVFDMILHTLQTK